MTTSTTINAHGMIGFLGRGAAQRELECLLEIAAGKTSKQAAKGLGCAPSTVEKAVERIFFKLRVSTRAALVAKAFAMGLISFGGVNSPTPERQRDESHDGVFIA